MADVYNKKALTKEEREALKPAFARVETAIAELETAMAAVRLRPGDDDLPGDGICGTGCGCSSFQGTGTGMRARCTRAFCRHTRLAHTT
jgi:hypothetical protein